MNTENLGENALGRFAKGPFEDFKQNTEFSPVDGVIEEILGRLGLLRRNQIVVDVRDDGIIPNSMKLLRDHDMRVINISKSGENVDALEREFRNFVVSVNVFSEHIDDIMIKLRIPNEFPLLVIDSNIVDTDFEPCVVVSTIQQENIHEEFKTAVDFWTNRKYTLVAHGGQYLVFVRDDLTTRIEVKPVVKRNPSMLFDWNYEKNI